MLTRSSRTGLVLALATAVPTGAWAQAPADTPPANPIIVTGRGLDTTPAAPAYDQVVIDRARLLSAASGRIEDVLGNVAGFQQFRRSDSRSSNPSAQGATLRALGGNATSRALVLLDGVPMADPFFGYIPFSAISPDRLGRVRVTRGGGWGAFGAGAVAGTIELESAGLEQLQTAEGQALVNDRAETEASASFAPRLGDGFAVLSGRWDRGQGFWTTPKSQRVAASARAKYDAWSGGIRFVAPLAPDVELQARGMAYDDRRTLRFAGADSTSSGHDASIRVVGRGRWAFDVLGYVQARDFSNVVISSTSFRKTLDQRRTPSTGIGGKLEVRPPLGTAHVARLGADIRVADGGLQEEACSAATGLVTARRRAGGRNADLGLYAEDDWTIGRLILTAGMRADRWTIRDGYFVERSAAGALTSNSNFPDRSGWETSLRAGGVYDVGVGFRLRGAAYTGLRLPTLNELYRPFVVFPVTTQPNAALRNERLRGFEAGIDFSPGETAHVSLTAFDNRLKNAVANVTIGPNLRQRRNIDAIRARGIEVDADARWGKVVLSGSLAWTDSNVESSGAAIGLDGLRPAQTPRLAYTTTLAWESGEGARLAATVRHTGNQFEDDLETDLLPAVTTLDAFARLPVGQGASVILRAENLTNERIVTRKQGASIDLGTPRTVWAGVRISLP
ncbi:TonB-dependent receptor [Novosphingobium tardum]|uniref:TonB-dependent receptor n=1 Tax=Novosphingobium tardum TaxID=1538021 RepID=A0ABV8RTV0_9SPHN